MEKNYVDLLYFGYEYDTHSYANECEFIAEIKKRFDTAVKLENAFDGIKGYRQEVFLDPSLNEDDYFAWILGNQWYNCSMTMQLIMLSASREAENKIKFDKYVALAKIQYPEAFKPEAL